MCGSVGPVEERAARTAGDPGLEVPVLRARLRHVLGVVGQPRCSCASGTGGPPVSRRRPAAETVTLVDPPQA